MDIGLFAGGLLLFFIGVPAGILWWASRIAAGTRLGRRPVFGLAAIYAVTAAAAVGLSAFELHPNDLDMATYWANLIATALNTAAIMFLVLHVLTLVLLAGLTVARALRRPA